MMVRWLTLEPQGTLLNRFGADVTVIDVELPEMVKMFAVSGGAQNYRYCADPAWHGIRTPLWDWSS